MKNTWQTQFRPWLIVGLMSLALLTLTFAQLAFAQDDGVDPAHCRPCKPATPTPTWTPTPMLQPCQISEIYFNEQLYPWGEIITAPVKVPLAVTVKLVDHRGQILIGANVDAAITQTDTVQAAASIPPLVDQSGTYDAVYTPRNTGLYLFKFSASDFTGPRFLPCSAEAKVRFVDDDGNNGNGKPCVFEQFISDRITYTIGSTINLTATVDTDGATAAVTATVKRPDNMTETVQLNLIGNMVYVGSYTRTNLTGAFRISAVAIDNEGEKDFAPCVSGTLTPEVVSDLPNPTPIVSVEPQTQIIDLCGRANPNTTNKVVAKDVSNLAEVDLIITYDPTFIIPSKISPIFAPGSITQTSKTIRYTARSNNPVSGTTDLITIDWRLQGRDGLTTVALTSNLKDPNGAPIEHLTQNGMLEVTISPPCLRCTVNLQGRTDHSRVMVTSSTGEQTESYPTGLFAIATTEQLFLTFPGYLSARMDVSSGAAGGSPGNTAANSCRANLLAGDVNNDQVVNILDLAFLAQRFQSADSMADLNADGVVNILDLALTAGNYQQHGPLTTWK